MKLASMMMKASVAFLVALVFPVGAQAWTENVVTNTQWSVELNGMDLGYAQNVCLNATIPMPANCPAGALDYGFGGPGWTTSSAMPGATWIWAPSIKATDPPVTSPEWFIFKRKFYLCDIPQNGVIDVAADNQAEVYINGFLVGNTAAYPAQTPPINVSGGSGPPLAVGENIIEVRVQNATNPTGCGTYQCNPAGVILAASFTDAGTGARPTCTYTGVPYTYNGTTYNTGMTFNVGQSRPVPCPSGYVGYKSDLCACKYFPPSGPTIAMWTGPSGQCSIQAPRRACVDFEAPLAVGTYYGKKVGQSPGDLAFSSNGISVFVEPFRVGPWTFFNEAYINALTVPGGASQSLRLNNLSLRFDFGQVGFTSHKATFLYHYQGGHDNIAINGNPSPPLDRIPLLPPSIGGYSVAVTATSPFVLGQWHSGTVSLSGRTPIHTLLVGGQELWIDEVCAVEG